MILSALNTVACLEASEDDERADTVKITIIKNKLHVLYKKGVRTVVFGNTISMANKSLDYLWRKMEVVQNNLANVDTPGYKKKTVSFEEVFNNRLRAASMTKNDKQLKEAISGADYFVYTPYDSSARVDENNVNADVEETEMARTSLHYRYLLQTVTADVKRYQSAIKAQ